jgi:hypothetical protein
MRIQPNRLPITAERLMESIEQSSAQEPAHA